MCPIKKYQAKKLSAFGLFESVIAVSIISILVGISSLVIGNLTQSEKRVAYFQAKEDVAFYFQTLKENQLFISQSFDKEIYTIQQEVIPYHDKKNLYQVTYLVLQGSEELYVEKHLLINERATTK